MAMTKRFIIGVFDEPAMADQAIEALQNAGFHSDQIHYMGHHTSGGFMAGLKSLFTGEGAADGSSVDDLTQMGASDKEARYYENEQRAGHAVVAVKADGREQEAMDILHTNGAYNYGARQSTTQADYGATNVTQTSSSTAFVNTNEDYANTTDERTMKLREEQLSVNKQSVQTGEVQLGKTVVSEQKTVNVPVTHEEAYIERRPVTDTTANDTSPISESETIRVPLSEEKVNVTRNTVVTGEVSIGKRAVQETQQVQDSVKREEARIEQQGDAPIHGTQSDHFHPNSVDNDSL